MTSETLSAKQVLWRERLLAWQQSGLSTAQWCRQQQLPEHQFFYWKRKLKPGTEHKLIPVVVPPEEEEIKDTHSFNRDKEQSLFQQKR